MVDWPRSRFHHPVLSQLERLLLVIAGREPQERNEVSDERIILDVAAKRGALGVRDFSDDRIRRPDTRCALAILAETLLASYCRIFDPIHTANMFQIGTWR